MKQGYPVSQESLNNSRAVHSSMVKITQRPGASQAQGSAHHPSSVTGTRSSYPRPHHVVSEPLGGLGFDDLHLRSRIPSAIQQSSMSSHRKQEDKAKQQATGKRVATNQTLILTEQQLEDLTAVVYNQYMIKQNLVQEANIRAYIAYLYSQQFQDDLRRDLLQAFEDLVVIEPMKSDQERWKPPDLKSTEKAGKQTSKPCSQTAEKKTEKIPEIEPALATPCQGEHQIFQLEQEEHVPGALCGPILDLTKTKEEGKLNVVLVVHKESSKTLIEQGGFIRFASYYSLTMPLVDVKFSLMDHLKLVKNLQNFIFEPGGKLCEFKSNNKILVQRATTELSMHETLILKEQDLRSYPFKGGGGSVAQISSNGKKKESKSELHQLLKDLQLWPHHPRPREIVIHAVTGAKKCLSKPSSKIKEGESGRDTANFELFTQQLHHRWHVHGFGDIKDEPKLKWEYGGHFTRPPDHIEPSNQNTMRWERGTDRDDRDLLILGHMGLVRPPELLEKLLDVLNNAKEHRSSRNTIHMEKDRDGPILLDGLDLRTNPFKGGGDGAIWISLNFKDLKLVCAPETSLLMVCFNEPKKEINGLHQRRTHGTALKQHVNRRSMEKSVTWTKDDLLTWYMDQKETKDVVDLLMDVTKKWLAEDGPFKPKKWKDKPAWV